MMRWPFSKPLPEAEQRERDAQLDRAAEFRRRAEQLTDELQALADRIDQELERRASNNGKPGKLRGA